MEQHNSEFPEKSSLVRYTKISGNFLPEITVLYDFPQGIVEISG